MQSHCDNDRPSSSGRSQAIFTTWIATSGGKDRLAAASRIVLEGKLASCPAFSPQADGVGVKVEASSGRRVGEQGALVQQQDQVGALAEVGRGRARAHQAPGLVEELIGEGRAMAWGRPRHETAPGATGPLLFSDDALTLSRPRSWATLQLFAEWTT